MQTPDKSQILKFSIFIIKLEPNGILQPPALPLPWTSMTDPLPGGGVETLLDKDTP
jgi:hypothetical protein